VCGDLGPFGAHCAHTLTEQKRDIPKEQWDVERIGYLCMDAEGFNDTETAIDQFCETSKLCDYVTRQEIKKTMARIRQVADQAKEERRKWLKAKVEEKLKDPGQRDYEDIMEKVCQNDKACMEEVLQHLSNAKKLHRLKPSLEEK
jgi:gas vesicle protein